MKISLRSIRLFQPAKLTALAIVILCGISVSPARADYIISLQQVGPDVIATGSGTLDVTGLDSLGVFGQTGGFMNPNEPNIGMGLGPTNIYQEPSGSFFSGPLNFGPGTVFGTLAD